MSAGAALGLGLAAWLFASTVVVAIGRVGAPGARWRGWRRAGAGFWGMVLAHAGLGVFIVGVTMVKGYEIERDVRMSVGDELVLAGDRITFLGVDETNGPNYAALRARLRVQRAGRDDVVLAPEKRLYRVQQMPMTEAAVDSGLTGDLYVSLGEALDERTWTVRVYRKPFVGWIWAGALLMALGGAAAALDRRYRTAPTDARATVPRASLASTGIA